MFCVVYDFVEDGFVVVGFGFWVFMDCGEYDDVVV